MMHQNALVTILTSDDRALVEYNLENKTVFLDAKVVSFIWDRIVRYIFDVFLMILMIIENKEF